MIGVERMNLASFLLDKGCGKDDQLALAIPRVDLPLQTDGGPQIEEIQYGELRKRIADFQKGIFRLGLRPGDRVIMLFPVCADFFALALALLAAGQVLVFLDGRLDRVRFLRVLAAAKAQAIVSVRPLLRFWPIVPALWGLRRIAYDRTGFGARSLSSLLYKEGDQAPDVLLRGADDSALLSFTSGSTGRPKGVDRTHSILLAQHLALKHHAPERSDEIDMPCFPAVVLHNLSCGLTSVLPPIDLRHPGAADPAKVLAAISRYKVNSMSGAPAYMGRLCDHLNTRGETVATMKRLVIGGAPVSRNLAARLIRAFPKAIGDAAYGSTEAEPMAGVSLSELAETEGDGYLVGRTTPVAELQLVDLPEIAPPLGQDGLRPYQVKEGESGEVLVKGPHVNRGYIGDDDAVRRYKVPDPSTDPASLWHRTGDLARRDTKGRYWLTGRVPDRVVHQGRKLDPYIIESQMANEVPEARLCALVSHPGAPEGELVFVCDDAVQAKVDDAARRILASRGLSDLRVRRVTEIPVDARHNSKIDRPLLRTQLAGKKA